ncbi:DUF3293 domain-containing protein [Thalassotalea litorea]|uniref:DUF3293 domain-containing protein n=1 Tax=Thalassotalea litorea TaxID=2020715 RepID=A0A5R9IPM3_9GAMM|nr:DUF3293 domain-containing protein [Thalassotalea litorea]TLU67494.1 DUF3293 domain-containing protein [Thalassotalea litorea]
MTKHISEELMQVYHDTLFSAIIDGDVLSIPLGKSNGELHHLLQQQGVYAAALISAYNPYSKKVSDKQNLVADQTLQDDLINQGYQFYVGEGRNDTSTWIEPSALVLNIDRRNACALACQYQQNTFVFVQSTPSHTLAEIVVSDE